MDAKQDVIVVANFPITDDISLRKCGTHRDINYEIVNHSRSSYDMYSGEMRPSMGTWCYYVIVFEKMLPKEQFEKFWLAPSSSWERSDGWNDPIYEYHRAAFSSVEWHGGVTYYEKNGGIDGTARWVKIGCDFAHLWDLGREYDFDFVDREAKATIDQLCEMFDFHSRCFYSGRWQPAREMIEHEGRLYSSFGLEKKLAFNARDTNKSSGV